jgi:hypothetical protein
VQVEVDSKKLMPLHEKDKYVNCVVWGNPFLLSPGGPLTWNHRVPLIAPPLLARYPSPQPQKEQVQGRRRAQEV